jgi:hypothetical protein
MPAPKIRRLSETTSPLAITMVDYSWMLKHHRYGAFDNFDRFFEELVERGYNAVRMDCFPHLIAADDSGVVQQRFHHKKADRAVQIWGYDFSIRSEPRKSLVQFLTQCRAHGIHVGLATWFMDHGTGRSKAFKGVDGFVRAWDETLNFINDHGLMDVVAYVDLLNEYPMAHGLTWLDEQLEQRAEPGTGEVGPWEDPFEKTDYYNESQVDFYQSFMRSSIDGIKRRWPHLDVFCSETGRRVPQDYENFDAIDKHFWISHNKELAEHTGFRRLTHNKPTDVDFHDIYVNGLKHWDQNKHRYAAWMEDRIQRTAELGRRYGVPVGNTEGWGDVFWEDNPTIDWRFIMEAAEICVPLAVKHGYKFICTSNFTCPQFRGMWEEVEWHQKMTRIIKAG